LEDDAELVERARAGDHAALTRLAEIYAPQVLRFALRLCGDAADAEDVMQQTLLTVINHIGEFRGDSRFASWLFAIARSHCIKQRTRGGAARSAEPLEGAARAVATPTSQIPDEAVARAELDEAMAGAIRALEPAQREVLLLRDVEALSALEVAQTLGVSVDAVKSRLHRARKSLRESLTPWLEQSTPGPGCPDVVDLLSRYQEGDVSSEACQTMQEHVDGCTACAKRCQALRRVLTACRATPLPVLSAKLQLALREQIRRSLERQGI